MMLNPKMVCRVLKREAKAVGAYRKDTPNHPPGKSSKGKADGWRYFQRMLDNHQIECTTNAKILGFQKIMGAF